jgi:hypothetical protein
METLSFRAYYKLQSVRFAAGSTMRELLEPIGIRARAGSSSLEQVLGQPLRQAAVPESPRLLRLLQRLQPDT